jgi:YesN/AraC family two-component response regulator
MKYRVLVVDDAKHDRFILKEIVKNLGYQSLEADNGKAALSVFESESCDLVITDLNMPIMDGLTLLETIKQKQPFLPVIIVSANDEREYVIKALRLGACDYITKPFEESEIQRSLERVFPIVETQVLDRLHAKSVIKESRQLVFDNNPEQIGDLVNILCQNLEWFDMKPEMLSIKIILFEALANSIFHGNLELSSDLKNHQDINSFDEYGQLAQEKSCRSPYNERKIFVDYTVDREKARYVIRDEGGGFDYDNLQDPLDPKSSGNPSGRGILMIRSFCDEVNWNKKGNEISLTKYKIRIDTIEE